MDTQENDEKTNKNKVPEAKLAWLQQRLVELKALEKEVNDLLINKYLKLTLTLV